MTSTPSALADALTPRTAPLDWPVRQGREFADWGTDPVSGARVVRLTSSPMHHSVIYTEQPYTSPDGRRIAIVRTSDTLSNERSLVVADVEDGRLWLVEPTIPGGIANTAYGEWIYYATHERGVRRVSLLTQEKQQVMPDGALPDGKGIVSVTPDLSACFIHDTRAEVGPALLAHDFATGQETVLYQDPENNNPHGQSDLLDGSRVLMQQSALRAGRAVEVFVFNRHTGEKTLLPIGGEHTAQSSGHMAWIGQTDQIACAVNWNRDERRHDPRHPDGNLVIVRVGDDQPRVIGGPGYAFYHVSISRCGRYFTCDEFMDLRLAGLTERRSGPVRIVVGSVETGRSRTLIADVQVNGIAGTPAFEPNPYMTADNRHVVYNGSPWGTQHAFAATVPDGFLESLD